MKIRVWKALAKGVWLESIRRKDMWVVAILGLLVVLSAGTLGSFGFKGLESFAKDLGLTVLGAFATIVAVLASCRVLPDELRHRTLYPLLARPISRFDLLLGKFVGAIVVSWTAFLLLAGVTAIALSVFQVGFEPVMLQYALLKMMGLAVVCAIGLMLSTWMTPSAATTLTLLLAFGSPAIVRALVLAGSTAGPDLRGMLQIVNAFIPQLGLFDISSRAVNVGWGPAPGWVVGFLAGYMALYSGAMLALSWTKFRRQAI